MLLGKKYQFTLYEMIRSHIKDNKEALRSLDASWGVFSWNVDLLYLSAISGIAVCFMFTIVANSYINKYSGWLVTGFSSILNFLIGLLIGLFVARIISVLGIRSIEEKDWKLVKDAVERCSHKIKDSNISIKRDGKLLRIVVSGKRLSLKIHNPKDDDVYTCDTDMVFKINEGGYISHKEQVLVFINNTLVLKLLVNGK